MRKKGLQPNFKTRNSSPKHANSLCYSIWKKTINPMENQAKDLNGYLSKEGMQMAMKHMRKCSAFTVREMPLMERGIGSDLTE